MRAWPLFALLVACHEPRVPRVTGPHSIHLLGAGDGELRGHLDPAGVVFTGRAAHEYAIEIFNDGPKDVGISLLVDGLDADTGEPAASCEHLCGWSVLPSNQAVVRGFSVDNESIATYRFAEREHALAMFTKGARREAIGTIEACFFTLRPAAPNVADTTGNRFRGSVESEPTAGAIVSEVKPRAAHTYGEVTCDRLVDRFMIRYQAEDGSPLGTAPPPAGIARVVRPPPPRRPTDTPESPPPEPPKGVKAPKPQKPPK